MSKSKTNILITDGMEKNSVEFLKNEFNVNLKDKTSKDELKNIIGDYNCIVVRSATKLTSDLIDRAREMKLIVRAGSGVDNIDVNYATSKKLPVMNTASANANAAGEHTIALIFSMLRQIPQASSSLKAGKWERSKFKGYEVFGKTLGLIGLGNIGQLVATKAIGLGMNVIGYDTLIKTTNDLNKLIGDKANYIKIVPTINNILKRSDIVSIHIPKNNETKYLINEERIYCMKSGSFLVNCARGGIVDEKAVLDALNRNHLRGAAFDVFEKEPTDNNALINHPKVVSVPHLGASTFEAQKRVAEIASKQIVSFFKESDRTGIINGL